MPSREVSLYVNSYFDASQPTDKTHNWTTFLAEPITGFRNCKVKLEDIELPNSCYNFADNSSELTYVLDVGGADTLKYIQINTNRVYNTVSDLVTEINQRFTANGDNIVASFSNETVKITLTNNTGVPVRIVSSFRWQNDPDISQAFNQINDRLGLTQDLSNVVIADNGELVGESVVRMLRTNCYYLICDILSSGGNVSVFQVPNPTKRPQILGKVTASNFGTLSQLQFGTELSIDVSDSTLSKISFRVLDDEFEPIDLNGSPVTFTMRISLS